jgi:hypothetical protein
MSKNSTVELRRVLVLRQMETGWFCELPDRPKVEFIGVMQIAPGTSMPAVGRRGTVMLRPAAADDLGVRKLITR